MSSSSRCKSKKRQQAKAMRQNNGLEAEAKEKVEHAIVNEFGILTTTTPTMKVERAN